MAIPARSTFPGGVEQNGVVFSGFHMSDKNGVNIPRRTAVTDTGHNLRTWPGVWRIGLLLCGTIWWGGLSFYATVVVPIGSDLIGSLQQGIITQRVTQWHNAISCLFTTMLLVEAFRRRCRALLVCGVILVVIDLGLIAWHHRLTSLLSQNEAISESFYDQHAVYLWMTTIEWSVGLFVMCFLFNSSGNDRNPDRRE
jgi:hypothetical protein